MIGVWKTDFFTAFLLTALLLPLSALADSFTAQGIKVHDGDTITVEREDGEWVKIRLWGIDCPESKQPWGSQATDFTTEKCLDKRVLVLGRDVDRYGRLVAEVMLSGQRILQHELQKAGLAWWYWTYAPEEGLYKILESAARRDKVGLWVGPEPVPPWEYRSRSKGTSGPGSAPPE